MTNTPNLPPAPVLDGEVARCLSDSLKAFLLAQDLADYPADHWSRRAADLLERQAAPVPVAVDGWQPIDTALKDGAEILASDYDAIEIVSWSKNLEWDTWYWTTRDGKVMFPAWWQPLADHPPLPTTTPAGQEGADG